MTALRLLLLLALLLPNLPAAAGPMTAAEVLSQFNLVTRGDFSSSADVEGRAAIGGNLTRGATFYNKPGVAAGSSFRALTVYGGVTTTGTMNINNGGGGTIGGTNAGRFNLNGGGALTTGALASLPGFQATFVDPLVQLSQSLGVLPANSYLPTGLTDMNNVKLTATAGTGLAVFNISAAELSRYTSFEVNLNGRSGAVFNVTGNLNYGGNFNNGINIARDIIWNFKDATGVSFNNSLWFGTILAPNATVSNRTPIEGTVFASSFNGSGEIHNQPFRQALPGMATTSLAVSSTAVPEPAGAALFGLGLLGAAAAAPAAPG